MPDAPHSVLADLAGRPWLGWLVVCLCRQQARQDWLYTIHKERLDRSDEDAGDVPGFDGWTFAYHGRGLCLTGPGREQLDVDFYNNDGRTIDPYFFATRVLTLEPVPGPEAQLLSWLPDRSLLVAAIRTLQEGPLLTAPGHVFALAGSLKEAADDLASVDFTSPETMTYFRGWFESSKPDEADPGVALAHARWLETLLEVDLSSAEAVVTALSGSHRERVATSLLARPIGPWTGSTIRALDECDVALHDEVTAVLRRLNPELHHPFVAWSACAYLLSRGLHKEQCLRALEDFSAKRIVKGYFGNPFDHELAHLCLCHAPARGLVLLRRALRSTTPACVESTAALLALIDEPWSRAEIEAALLSPAQAGEPTPRRRLATALLHSKDEGTRKRGAQLMPPSRKRREDDVGYTFDEVAEASLEQDFHCAIETARKEIKHLDLHAIALAHAAQH